MSSGNRPPLWVNLSLLLFILIPIAGLGYTGYWWFTKKGKDDKNNLAQVDPTPPQPTPDPTPTPPTPDPTPVVPKVEPKPEPVVPVVPKVEPNPIPTPPKVEPNPIPVEPTPPSPTPPAPEPDKPTVTPPVAPKVTPPVAPKVNPTKTEPPAPDMPAQPKADPPGQPKQEPPAPKDEPKTPQVPPVPPAPDNGKMAEAPAVPENNAPEAFDRNSPEAIALKEDAIRRIEEAPRSEYPEARKRIARVAIDRAREIVRAYTVSFEIEGNSLSASDIQGIKNALATPEAEAILQKQKAVIFVLGFADPSGPADFNIALSKRRANTVAEHLKNELGIQLESYTVGIGPTQIINPVNQEKNRAAELWLVVPDR